MPTPKVVIFDIYKTLINFQNDETKPDTYRFISSWLSYKGLIIKSKTLQSLYQEKVKEEMEANNESYPDIDIGKVFKKIIFSIGEKYDGEIKTLIKELCLLFRMLTTETLEIYPGTVPMLESLYKKVRLAIVSNAQRLFTIPELKRFDIEKYFECIIFSSDVKVSKPNPKIFTTLLSSIKVQPQEALYVGDNLFDDIWGAQKVGIKTIWIDHNDLSNFPDELEKPTPDRKIKASEYHRLPDIILSLCNKGSDELDPQLPYFRRQLS